MKTRCLGCMAEYEKEYGLCPHCGYEQGTQADSALHMQPGSILNDRYLIGKVIGYGGFGVTYIGWDMKLQQRVAVKEYLPSEFATRAVGQTQVTVFGGNKSEQFAGGLAKFVEEAKRLIRFQNEPGIVHVFDSFEANNTAYIVMEYLDGETLTSYLEREGKIPVDAAIEMLTPVIRSLEAVHAAGIIHRDIAPDNIMITSDGAVKLIDFGAARYATTSHSRSLTVIIKPGYSPEEQYRSRGEQGPHTDVYALSAVLYRMITGITPPDALERRALLENRKKDILLPPSKNCRIKKNQENAILNAMNVQAEDRTPTAAGFLEELTSPSPVQRVMGKVKAIDLMKWPLWAKILIPAGGLAVAVLFALLLAGKIGFASSLVDSFTLGENMTRVPSVINCSIGVAQEKLEEQTLTAVISGREFSDTIPANLVLRQGINAGGVVEKGTSVNLYVSETEVPVIEAGTMPDVLFYQEDDAAEILDQLGVEVNIEYEYSEDVAPGLVFYTSIGASDVLNPGDTVTMIVSKGPDPAAAEKPEEGQTAAGTKDLRLNRSSLNLFVGDTVELTASGEGPYSWTTSNAKVASVKDGKVTAVGKGTASIKVSANGRSVSCRVTVQDYKLTLSKSYMQLGVGGSTTLTASGAPSGARITWRSSDPDRVAVNNGKVTAVAAGGALITAQFTNGGKTYSASCNVYVTEFGLELTEYTASMYEGDSLHLCVSGTLPAGQSGGDNIWSSSDPSVATVRETAVNNAEVTAVGSGSTVITVSVTAGGKTYSASCSVTVRKAGISISRSRLSLSDGETAYLSAPTTPGGRDVTWSSSNSRVVTVYDGRVTAVGGGSATITASMYYEGKSYTADCSVYVEEAGIELDCSSLTLSQGDYEYLCATTMPGSASVSWESSDTSVATVSGSGRVTAVGKGTAVITASMYYDGEYYEDSCRITVNEELTPSIDVSTVSITTYVGLTEDPSDVTTTPSGQSVSWRSSDTSVVTVSSSGVVTAVGEGTATVTASMVYGGKTYEDGFRVTVRPRPTVLPSIKLSAASMSMTAGETETLTATVTPSDQSVSWKSSDASVAAVSGGRVTALKEGKATITAVLSYSGCTYEAYCAVTVTEPDITPGIELSDTSLSLNVGESEGLSASTTPGGQKVTWLSNDTSVATVSSSGKVTAVGSGSTTIQASMDYGQAIHFAFCKVTVSAPRKMSYIDMEPESPTTLQVGESVRVKAYACYSDGSSVSITDSSSIYSNDPSVVAVSNGKLTGVSEGTTLVMCDYEGFSGYIRVYVTDAEKDTSSPQALNP